MPPSHDGRWTMDDGRWTVMVNALWSLFSGLRLAWGRGRGGVGPLIIGGLGLGLAVHLGVQIGALLVGRLAHLDGYAVRLGVGVLADAGYLPGDFHAPLAP